MTYSRYWNPKIDNDEFLQLKETRELYDVSFLIIFHFHSFWYKFYILI